MNTSELEPEELRAAILELMWTQAWADMDDNEMLSHWEVNDVHREFPGFSPLQVKRALDDLVDANELCVYTSRMLYPSRLRTIYYVNLEGDPRSL